MVQMSSIVITEQQNLLGLATHLDYRGLKKDHAHTRILESLSGGIILAQSFAKSITDWSLMLDFLEAVDSMPHVPALQYRMRLMWGPSQLRAYLPACGSLWKWSKSSDEYRGEDRTWASEIGWIRFLETTKSHVLEPKYSHLITHNQTKVSNRFMWASGHRPKVNCMTFWSRHSVKWQLWQWLCKG